jgi:hypothetical protein
MFFCCYSSELRCKDNALFFNSKLFDKKTAIPGLIKIAHSFLDKKSGGVYVLLI